MSEKKAKQQRKRAKTTTKRPYEPTVGEQRNVADVRLRAFANDVEKLREKYGLSDVVIISECLYLEDVADEPSVATTVSQFGDANRAPLLAGMALGYYRQKLEGLIAGAVNAGQQAATSQQQQGLKVQDD